MKTVEEYNKIFQEAIAKVMYRERNLRVDKITVFCYENGIPSTTMNSIENAKNDSGMTYICRIMNCMGIDGMHFMMLVNKELPENFWEEWRNAEFEKDKKAQEEASKG